MTVEHGISRPNETIVRWALLIGVVGFLGGFFGPMILAPDSNLGPILGFGTGPIGAFVGALVGVARSARAAAPSVMPTIAGWLFGAWLLALLGTFFMVNLLSGLGLLLGAALQAMVVAFVIYVFSQRDIRQKWSLTTRRRAPLVIVTLTLILIVTVFPPVMRPWWGSPQPTANNDSQQPLPQFAFVLDDRLDSSGRVPLLAVNFRLLALEWIAVAVTTSLFGWLLIRPKAD